MSERIKIFFEFSDNMHKKIKVQFKFEIRHVKKIN